MSNGILKIKGDKVVDASGTPIILRGAGLGGWMKYFPLPTTLTSKVVADSFTAWRTS
jgi:hypothetical protein